MKKNLRFSVALPIIVGLVSMVGTELLYAKERAKPASYELYSWKKGNDWEYSLLPRPAKPKAAIEIKRLGGPLRGASKIKEKFLQMAEGDKIYWQERPDSGMVYPPEPVIEELKDYAETVGVKITLPR
jgi:hypothetical protein